MKSIRFPRFPRLGSDGAPSRKKNSGTRLFLSGAVLLAVCFLLGIYLFFPTDILLDRIEQDLASQANLEVSVEDLRLSFPPGLLAKDITLSAPRLPQDIRLDTLRVKPLWSSLFSTNQGVSVVAGLYGGELEADLKRHGEVEAQASGMNLSVPIAPGSAIQVATTLGQANLSGRWPIRPDTETTLNMTLSALSLSGMKGIGAQNDIFSLGSVSLQASGKGNALRIEKLENSGGQMAVSGSGTLQLAQPIDRSRINLTITLKPGTGMDPTLTETLGLFAKQDRNGSFNLRILGTLSNPQVR